MKLQLKLAIYYAISKALIILAIGFILPVLVERVVINHIGKRLEARRDIILKKIKLGGLDQALLEKDCSFDDYNIFKEEFIHIDPLNVAFNHVPKSSIANQDWSIDDRKSGRSMLSGCRLILHRPKEYESIREWPIVKTAATSEFRVMT